MTSDEADRCGPPVRVFRSTYLKGVRFELRPLDRTPPDSTVAIMYRRNADGFRQAGIGVFKDGAWKNARRKVLQGEGLLWAAMVDEQTGATVA